MTSPVFQPFDKEIYFSPRQIQILALTSEGLSVTEIGIRLQISVKTVSTYKIRIKEKLKDVVSDEQFLAYARNYFLLPECAAPEVTDCGGAGEI